MINGLFLVNKEKGITSREALNKLTKKLSNKKMGHCGTLDPFATGLLLVASGKALKLLPYLEDLNKTYVATLKLGVKTITGDYTGEVVKEEQVKDYSLKEIEDTLNSFLGESYQIPPMFSALKKDGVPLYKLARQGQEIERKPRQITVYLIKLLSCKDNIIKFEANVSKGTYIRTLGEDIANKLGTVGHLLELERTSIGNYKISQAKLPDEILEKDAIEFNKISLKINQLKIDDELLIKKITNGVKINLNTKDDIILLVDNNDRYLAIYERIDKDLFGCKRGLL